MRRPNRRAGWSSSSEGLRPPVFDVVPSPDQVLRAERRARLAELAALIQTLNVGGAAGL